MNRRAFFATLAASFLAAKARLFPNPVTSWTTDWREMAADNLFHKNALLVKLRQCGNTTYTWYHMTELAEWKDCQGNA